MIEKRSNFLKSLFQKIFIFVFYLILIIGFLYFSEILKSFFKNKNYINVYTPTDMISPIMAQKFKEETGININLKYFDTNEELFAKFQLAKGQGYDLIIVSDYMVELLKKKSLLKNIDKGKIKNYKNLDKRLLNRFFDLENKYSVPYFWSLDGIVYDKNLFKEKNLSWKTVFYKKDLGDNKICMHSEAHEIFLLGALYLFGRTTNLLKKDLEKVKNLLIKQKKFVEVYMLGSLQYYLLGKVVPLAVTNTAFARKLLEVSDNYGFYVPREGSLLLIDCLAVPKASDKLNLVYKFINFLLSEKVMLFNSNEFGYNPSNKKSYPKIQKEFLEDKSFFPDDWMFKKLYLLNNKLDMEVIGKLWLEVRLS